MGKLNRKSLRWSLATPEQKKKLMVDLVDIFIQLSKHPFKLLGNLDCSADPSRVGSFARESLTNFTTTSEMRTTGPFSLWEKYHRSSLQLTMDLILRGEMDSQRPVDAYLIHRFLLDLLPTVLSSASTVDSDGGSPRYFLKHADDKGTTLLVSSTGSGRIRLRRPMPLIHPSDSCPWLISTTVRTSSVMTRSSSLACQRTKLLAVETM
ncbi:hypothetical protein F4679DRAFT_529182 [Xylaria curta]|nr:hypothetical protein F4679DRAFT_529182 [Xylaria curta]